MASLLDTITTGPEKSPPRVLVYGPEGIGKTSFALSAPRPIFIPTETGTKTYDAARFPLCTSFDAVLQAITALLTNPHEYQTVVLDSLDALEPMVWAVTCARFGEKDIEGKSKGSEFGYGKGYHHALTEWRRLLKGLEMLRDKGMNVILCAHAGTERVDDPETESYTRHAPKLNKQASALVREWCDAVLCAALPIRIAVVDKGDKIHERATALALGSERVLYANPSPARVAKNRFGIVDEIPFPKGAGWTNFAALVAAHYGETHAAS